MGMRWEGEGREEGVVVDDMMEVEVEYVSE